MSGVVELEFKIILTNVIFLLVFERLEPKNCIIFAHPNCVRDTR